VKYTTPRQVWEAYHNGVSRLEPAIKILRFRFGMSDFQAQKFLLRPLTTNGQGITSRTVSSERGSR
jgi:hypothetical protein